MCPVAHLIVFTSKDVTIMKIPFEQLFVSEIIVKLKGFFNVHFWKALPKNIFTKLTIIIYSSKLCIYYSINSLFKLLRFRSIHIFSSRQVMVHILSSGYYTDCFGLWMGHSVPSTITLVLRNLARKSESPRSPFGHRSFRYPTTAFVSTEVKYCHD